MAQTTSSWRTLGGSVSPRAWRAAAILDDKGSDASSGPAAYDDDDDEFLLIIAVVDGTRRRLLLLTGPEVWQAPGEGKPSIINSDASPAAGDSVQQASSIAEE